MATLKNEKPELFTVAEVAEMARISRMTVYRMVRSGELPALRVGSVYRVPRSAVEELMSRFVEYTEKGVANS